MQDGSCESHNEGKAASHSWESITARQANPSYEACASIIKTAAHSELSTLVATREALFILCRGHNDLEISI